MCIWKSLNYFMIFKPVHVFSYICYLNLAPPWGPSRYQVHFASRITYIIDCIRTSALILRWRRSVYLLGSALTFFWPLVMWTIITLFYCTVYFRSEYKYICIYIFLSELVLLYLKWFRIRLIFVKLFLWLSIPILLCIIIIIHWAIVAQSTFLLFFFSFRFVDFLLLVQVIIFFEEVIRSTFLV